MLTRHGHRSGPSDRRNATFQCAGEEKEMALLFGWDFICKGGMLTTVITGTTVAGVSMVTVSGDRTQLPDHSHQR